MFQKGLEDAGSASEDSSSPPPQTSVFDNTPSTVALEKWIPFFMVLRNRKEIWKNFCRAGILEVLSGILAAARPPKTVAEGDQIESIKLLSRRLVTFDSFA